jgi:hypothetical protein
MAKLSRPRGRTLALAGGGVVIVVIAIVLAVGTNGSQPPAAPAASDLVLSPGYATSIGFPKTYQAAKKATSTGEKGCAQSIGAVYEDQAGKTALISDVLNCSSKSAASSALAAVRKQVTVATGVKIPKGLGTSAFVTATRAPEYLIVWRAGNRVAITSVDVNVPASSSTSTSTPTTPITSAQTNTLFQAALTQNSLYR